MSSEGVDHASDLSQRVLYVSPVELRRLPAVFHRYLSESALNQSLAAERLSVSAVFETHPTAFTEWGGALLEQVERRAQDVLSQHRCCIRESIACMLKQGTMVHPNRCIVANAFALWRAHWHCATVQFALERLADWGTLVVRQMLATRYGTPTGGSSQLVRSSEVGVQRGALSDLIARQVLVSNLANFGVFARGVLQRYSTRPTSTSSAVVTRADRKLLDPVMPPMWVEVEGDRCQSLCIWHEGYAALEALNRVPCGASRCATERDPAAMAQTCAFPGGIRAALNQGLTFTHLQLGIFDPP